jgi:hypothetical protein
MPKTTRPNKRKPKRTTGEAPTAQPLPPIASRRLGNPREVRFTPSDHEWLAKIAKADSLATNTNVLIADVVRTAVAFYRQAREQSEAD